MEHEHDIAIINSRIDKIEVTLSHAVDAIEKIAAIVNRPQHTQWGPILTAVGLLIMAAGGYTTLVTQPMRSDIEKAESRIVELQQSRLNDAYTHGIHDGKLAIIEDYLNAEIQKGN